MIFSAGDAGANSFAAPPMDVISCFPSHAMWPADSPYVTAVSATYFTPLAEPLCYYSSDNGGINCLDNPLGEVAVGIDYGMFWTTGGGFSDIFAQPSYQVSFFYFVYNINLQFNFIEATFLLFSVLFVNYYFICNIINIIIIILIMKNRRQR